MATTFVKLTEIAFDAGTQIRAAINEDVVASYAERMQTGDQFPPIVLFHDGNQNYLADGFHRYMAAKRCDWVGVSAEVHAGTKTDALWFALGANRTNGQRMTDADKRHAIELAYATWPDKGQREIADQVGCSARYVSTVRDQIQVRSSSHLPDYITGKDGKQYPASRGPNQRSVEKREQIASLVREGAAATDIARQVGASLTTVTEVRRSLGVPTIDKTKVGVAQRRKDIKDMAARGFSTRQIASALGITEPGVGEIAKAEGIVIHADRTTGKTHRHDANRIVSQMSMDAENLTSDVNLIEFSSLDPDRIEGWIESFTKSRQSLTAFIRRLAEEQKKHVEDKQQVHAQAV